MWGKGMARERGTEDSQTALSGAAEDVRVWRQAHRKATFAAIEAAVEERLASVRARLVAEAAGAEGGARSGTDNADQRPCCPQCGHELQWRGQRVREVTVRGGEAVRLARQYGVCLACGAGLFPPG
jgi:hypothetical protein